MNGGRCGKSLARDMGITAVLLKGLFKPTPMRMSIEEKYK